jgi:hypothetical protein
MAEIIRYMSTIAMGTGTGTGSSPTPRGWEIRARSYHYDAHVAAIQTESEAKRSKRHAEKAQVLAARRAVARQRDMSHDPDG